MTRANLTEDGYHLDSDAHYHRTVMTSGGRVAPPGSAFVALEVKAVRRGASPAVLVHNGPGGRDSLIHRVDAVAGAKVDRREHPERFGRGIYLEVLGDPSLIEVEVLWW